MKRKRSDIPSKTWILKYWKKRLIKYNRDIENIYTCFSCLREGGVQRAHIDALNLGGSNNAENLHLLCPNCHTESEGYGGKIYWLWFNNKDVVFMPLYRNIERANIAHAFAMKIKNTMPDHVYKKILKAGSMDEMLALYDDFIKPIEICRKSKTQNTLF